MTDDSTTPSPSPAAGWYPDPALQGTARYYDGTSWTEHTLPASGDVVTKRSSRKGWIIGGSIAAGAVVVALIAGVAISMNSGSSVQAAATPLNSAPEGNLVAVPNLIGMTVGDARTDIDAIGLTLYVPNGTDDQAIIATQAYSAGREVAMGTEVFVTVESTPEPEADGSMANPYPVGYTMILSDTATNVEVFSLMARPAEETNVAQDVPVEPTTDGMRVVAVEFAVVGLDPSAAELDIAMEAGLWQVADQDGIGYSPLFTQVLTDPDVPMADGTVWGGRNFYEVPATATTPWVLVYDGYVALQ